MCTSGKSRTRRFSTSGSADAEAYHDGRAGIAAVATGFGDGVFYQAPLYPYFLAVCTRCSATARRSSAFIQAVIGAGSCVLLAAAGIALFGRGELAGVLLAIYPSAIFLDGLLDKSTLVSFFTAALLHLLSARHVRFREVLAGLVLGLLALTRENALLLTSSLLPGF